MQRVILRYNAPQCARMRCIALQYAPFRYTRVTHASQARDRSISMSSTRSCAKRATRRRCAASASRRSRRCAARPESSHPTAVASLRQGTRQYRTRQAPPPSHIVMRLRVTKTRPTPSDRPKFGRWAGRLVWEARRTPASGRTWRGIPAAEFDQPPAPIEPSSRAACTTIHAARWPSCRCTLSVALGWLTGAQIHVWQHGERSVTRRAARYGQSQPWLGHEQQHDAAVSQSQQDGGGQRAPSSFASTSSGGSRQRPCRVAPSAEA